MIPEIMDEIILASDVVMVARGDLGVEIGDANLPAAQKQLIRRSRTLNRAVITATQMMESMIENPIPTRAEVCDVANAVLDGTDAIMLSAETASGKYPVEAIEAMDRVCKETEKQVSIRTSNHRVDSQFDVYGESYQSAGDCRFNRIRFYFIMDVADQLGDSDFCF
jgi:pyruvate kinase